MLVHVDQFSFGIESEDIEMEEELGNEEQEETYDFDSEENKVWKKVIMNR